MLCYSFNTNGTPATKMRGPMHTKSCSHWASVQLHQQQNKAVLFTSASRTMHPMLSNTRTGGTQKFSMIFFPRNTNFTISQLSCGGNVPQGNWMQPYRWIHKPMKAAHWLTGMHKATSITTRIKTGLGWVGFFPPRYQNFRFSYPVLGWNWSLFIFKCTRIKKPLGYCWKLDKTLHCFLARTPSWNIEDPAECCIWDAFLSVSPNR